jgi:hypothetical protein
MGLVNQSFGVSFEKPNRGILFSEREKGKEIQSATTMQLWTDQRLKEGKRRVKLLGHMPGPFDRTHGSEHVEELPGKEISF